ncbi:MAG: BON domain-containing protein [Candidatus Rokubacteria bacterium]|nr:BON domain-containing protein [Candidatus Rokubacteria bacterium]
MDPRHQDDEERPGYVIGPASGGADVQLGGAPGETGVTRSDEQIRADIEARIGASSLAAHGIEVRVVNRVVTLAGRVPDEAAKHLAEHIGETVAGVRSVRSELTAERGASAA